VLGACGGERQREESGERHESTRRVYAFAGSR